MYKTGSRDLVNNYQSVSLINVVVELMGKIIRMTFVNCVEGHNLFSETGVSKSVSCWNILSELII